MTYFDKPLPDSVYEHDVDGKEIAIRTNAAKGDMSVDAWGIPKVSLPKSLFHASFTFFVPKRFFKFESGAIVTTSTAITSVNAELSMAATAAFPDLVLEGRECPRYQPNRGHLYSTSMRLPNKTADGTRDWGLGTTENQILFRLKTDGLLYAVRRSGNVEVAEELIDTSVLTGFNVEMGNIYDIQYQWRGVGSYKFYIGDPSTGGLKLVHTFNLLGTLTGLSIENPAMPVCYSVQRNTEDLTLFSGCVDVTSENGGQLDDEPYSSYSESVSINGTDVPVLITRLPDLIGGKTNTITTVFARMSVNLSKKGVFKLWVTRDSTAVVGATFVSLDGESVTETDSPDRVAGAVRATSVDITKMIFIAAINVEANGRSVVESVRNRDIRIKVVRGDYVVITCTASTSTADAVYEWGEES